jgi:uncharacterized caspase-like protein
MPVNASDYALVLGINDYPGIKDRSLKGAIRDAEQFRDWLHDTTLGGGVPADNVKTVLSKGSPVAPLHDEVDEALDRLVQRATEHGSARRFYFFFSGHGIAQIEQERTPTAFCLGKWTEHWRNYALDSDCYVNYIVNTQRFAEVILFADCCRIRKFTAYGRCPAMGNIAPGTAPSAVRQFRAHATELMDFAYEAAEASGSEVRGHFSRALMNGLWGAAAGPDGGVKALRLKEYLEREVPRLAKLANHKQSPVIVPEFATADEPVFGSASPVPAQVNVRVTFSDTTAGPIELEGPEIDTFQRTDASIGTWPLSLTAGTYILRRPNAPEVRFVVDSLREVKDVNA